MMKYRRAWYSCADGEERERERESLCRKMCMYVLVIYAFVSASCLRVSKTSLLIRPTYPGTSNLRLQPL